MTTTAGVPGFRVCNTRGGDGTAEKYVYRNGRGFYVRICWGCKVHIRRPFATIEEAVAARVALLAELGPAPVPKYKPQPKPQPQVHRPTLDAPADPDDDGPFVGEPPLTVRGSIEMYWAAWKRIHVLPPEKYPCETTSASSVASLQVAS